MPFLQISAGLIPSLLSQPYSPATFSPYFTLHPSAPPPPVPSFFPIVSLLGTCRLKSSIIFLFILFIVCLPY